MSNYHEGRVGGDNAMMRIEALVSVMKSLMKSCRGGTEKPVKMGDG